LDSVPKARVSSHGLDPDAREDRLVLHCKSWQMQTDIPI
jgi:hypothetical protein